MMLHCVRTHRATSFLQDTLHGLSSGMRHPTYVAFLGSTHTARALQVTPCQCHSTIFPTGPSSSTSQFPSSSSSSSANSSAATLSGRCLLVCAVTSDSRVWQWEVQLPAYPRRSYLADVSHQPITAINSSIQVLWKGALGSFCAAVGQPSGQLLWG
jgi:hypothetical protein